MGGRRVRFWEPRDAIYLGMGMIQVWALDDSRGVYKI